jgi:hypothetical protein
LSGHDLGRGVEHPAGAGRALGSAQRERALQRQLVRGPADRDQDLAKLVGQYAINVPTVMAAVLLSVLPLVVLFVVMRKQVMRSLGSVVMR